MTPVSGEGSPPSSPTAVCWLGPCGVEGARGGFSKAANPIHGTTHLAKASPPNMLTLEAAASTLQCWEDTNSQSMVETIRYSNLGIHKHSSKLRYKSILSMQSATFSDFIALLPQQPSDRAASGLRENVTQQLTPTPTYCWLHKHS